MTVKELIDLLQDFDDDTEVVIAEYQSHGTDFAYDVSCLRPGTVTGMTTH